jgi:hypothetical protein
VHLPAWQQQLPDQDCPLEARLLAKLRQQSSGGAQHTISLSLNLWGLSSPYNQAMFWLLKPKHVLVGGFRSVPGFICLHG